MKPKKEREPSSFALCNPARLIPSQTRFVSLNADQRYVPVSRKASPSGIVMLMDCDPAAPEEVTRCKFTLTTTPAHYYDWSRILFYNNEQRAIINGLEYN